jgi:hypothetical protein
MMYEAYSGMYEFPLIGQIDLIFCPVEVAFLFASMHLQKVLSDSLTSGQHTDYRQLFYHRA